MQKASPLAQTRCVGHGRFAWRTAPAGGAMTRFPFRSRIRKTQTGLGKNEDGSGRNGHTASRARIARRRPDRRACGAAAGAAQRIGQVAHGLRAPGRRTTDPLVRRGPREGRRIHPGHAWRAMDRLMPAPSMNTDELDERIRSGKALSESMGNFHVTGWDAGRKALKAAFTVRREY